MDRVARQFGIEEGQDVTAFPQLTFKDPDVDPVNISQ
jgi:hypothetical protein